MLQQYIQYQPSTFSYGNSYGTQASDDDDDEDGDDDGEAQPHMSEELLLKKIDQFAKDMLASDSGNDEKDEDTDHDGDTNETCDSETPEAVVEPTISPTDLLNNVRLLMKAKSTKAILENVSKASSCLSGVSTIQGALGDERKANTLLGRWTVSKKQVGKDDKLSGEGIKIERDTLIHVNVKKGSFCINSYPSVPCTCHL